MFTVGDRINAQLEFDFAAAGFQSVDELQSDGGTDFDFTSCFVKVKDSVDAPTIYLLGDENEEERQGCPGKNCKLSSDNLATVKDSKTYRNFFILTKASFAEAYLSLEINPEAENLGSRLARSFTFDAFRFRNTGTVPQIFLEFSVVLTT